MSPTRPLATMAAHLPPLPLFVFLLFIGVHASASHGSPSPPPLAPSYDGSICSESFMCGGVNISYPFYLSNATRGTADYTYSCGYTDLEIYCQGVEPNEAPVLHIGGDYYAVLDIFYDNRIIVLADREVISSGGSCPTVSHNVSFSEMWLHNTSSNENLTFFFGCVSLPKLSQYRIDCNGNGPPVAGANSYVLTPYDQDKVQELESDGHCKEVISVPVNSSLLTVMASNNWTWFKNGGYGDVLKHGFHLGWNRTNTTTDECYLCEQSGGRCAYSDHKRFLGCLCYDGKVGDPDCNHIIRAPRKSIKKIVIIAGVAGAGFAVLSAAIFVFMRKRKQKNVINSSSKLLKYSGSGGTPHSRVGDMESGSVEDLPTHLFTYEELEEATHSFDENRELGDGGFGTVYKGFLKDGRVVAVKRLYNNSYRRVEQFQNEAAILSNLRHPNLVMFYGCTSSQSRELLLVYEFVANGTVADHLHGRRAPERALSWPLRLNIAVESAAALTYLHAIEPPVVHRDVKTTNILLDSDYHVKVADFGLSRLFPLDVTHVSTAPQGTPGYVDPEYHQCYQLTDKSDVYSFGVVLVELISSKPAVDITRHRNEINLAVMAINKIQKCQLEELVDLGLGYETDPATKKMMTMVAELAFRCLQQNGEMRPPIKEVLEVLKSIQDECLVLEKNGDKSKDGPFSPTTVHAPWESRETTPNTSRD